MLPRELPAGDATGIAEFDAAVLRFASDDLLWMLQAKVKDDAYSSRNDTPYGSEGFTLPEEGWYALQRLMLADTVMRIGRSQPDLEDPDADGYRDRLENLAGWLCNTRWALGVMDLRHQQGGVVRMRDFSEWLIYATAGAYLLKHEPRDDWSPRLAAYIQYIVALLQMQLRPSSYRSLMPSQVREVFDEFLQIAEATTVTVTTKALPQSQEAIAERLNHQLT